MAHITNPLEATSVGFRASDKLKMPCGHATENLHSWKTCKMHGDGAYGGWF